MFECLVLVPSSSVSKPATNSIISSQLIYIDQKTKWWIQVCLTVPQITHQKLTHGFILCFMCMYMCAKLLQLCPTLCDPMDCIASQAPLSMGFSRQEYWIGLPFPPPQDLPRPGIEPTSLMSPALTGMFFTTSITWEANCLYIYIYILPWQFGW